MAGSPTLQARERLVFDRHTQGLAELLAEESGARPHDVEPWVVANALMGVNVRSRTSCTVRRSPGAAESASPRRWSTKAFERWRCWQTAYPSTALPDQLRSRLLR